MNGEAFTGQGFLDVCIWLSMALMMAAFFVIIYRIFKGPTLPDRIVGLDMLVAVGFGFIAIIGVATGYYLYLDIAIALALVGFLATVAFARFVLQRDEPDEDRAEDGADVATKGERAR